MSDLADAIRMVYTQQYLFWDLVQKIEAEERAAALEQDKFIISLG